MYLEVVSSFFLNGTVHCMYNNSGWLRGLFALLVLMESIDLSYLFVYSLAFYSVVLVARHKGIHKSLLVPLFIQEAHSSVISCIK